MCYLTILKFIYSEKARKFFEISTLLLTGTTQDKSKVEISQNFVAFSEYMNFTKDQILSWCHDVSRLFIFVCLIIYTEKVMYIHMCNRKYIHTCSMCVLHMQSLMFGICMFCYYTYVTNTTHNESKKSYVIILGGHGKCLHLMTRGGWNTPKT